MNYYKDQLARINTKSEFSAGIKLFDPLNTENHTKTLALNPESAQALIDWLTENFIAPAKPEIKTEDLDDHFQSILDSTINGQKQQAKDLIAELNNDQKQKAVSFFKRECQPDAELLDMLTYWLIG